MLCSDRQPYGRFRDSLLPHLLFIELGVSRAGRMNDQGFYIRYIGKKRKDSQAVDKLMRFLPASLDFKGKDGGAALREVSLV